MMIRLKSKREIEIMFSAGKILAEIHDLLEENIVPGISTYDLDRMAEEWIRKRNAKPAFKGYSGFPGSLCTSVNHQVVHGIPSKKVILEEGDIISIDSGVVFDGYYSDAARTHFVGSVSEAAQNLCRVTEQSLWLAIEQCQPGNRLGDVGWAVEQLALSKGYGVVREYVGHGIGKHLHEKPDVPNYGPANSRMTLPKGLVIAIEPMINLGTEMVDVLEDNWTVVTRDRSLSAHYEHTIAITEDGPMVLTESLSHPGRMTRPN
jgi:methionyl aminopeptidase